MALVKLVAVVSMVCWSWSLRLSATLFAGSKAVWKADQVSAVYQDSCLPSAAVLAAFKAE